MYGIHTSYHSIGIGIRLVNITIISRINIRGIIIGIGIGHKLLPIIGFPGALGYPNSLTGLIPFGIPNKGMLIGCDATGLPFQCRLYGNPFRLTPPAMP